MIRNTQKVFSKFLQRSRNIKYPQFKYDNKFFFNKENKYRNYYTDYIYKSEFRKQYFSKKYGRDVIILTSLGIIYLFWRDFFTINLPNTTIDNTNTNPKKDIEIKNLPLSNIEDIFIIEDKIENIPQECINSQNEKEEQDSKENGDDNEQSNINLWLVLGIVGTIAMLIGVYALSPEDEYTKEEIKKEILKKIKELLEKPNK